jgi:hypothetical protein
MRLDHGQSSDAWPHEFGDLLGGSVLEAIEF